MRTGKWVGVGLMLAGGLVLQSETRAIADVASDRAASIVVYPKIVFDSSSGVDTVIQLSNTGATPVAAHCFYIDATNHCTGNNRACDPVSNPCAGNEGLCLPPLKSLREPGLAETDFRIVLTGRQPVGWLASSGFAQSDLPLPGGLFGTTPNGQSNAGTHVPPVAEDPFVGELKCIVVDATQAGEPAIANNVLKGEATIVSSGNGVDVDKYSAVGIQGIN